MHSEAVIEPAPAPAAGEPSGLELIQGAPALIGRTCVVLGGAFVFRSLTESGVVSGTLGVSLGLLYAIAWLALADRAGRAGHRPSSAFHALAATLIAYPLVVEATVRFHLIGPTLAALALGATTLVGLVVAWRRVLPAVVWITVLAALASGVGLLLATRAPLPFVPYLLALAVGSLVLAYGHGWRGQRWVVAIALDLVVLHLGGLRLIGRPTEWLPASALLLAQLGLVCVYLGAFVLRLLVQAHEVTPFAVFQTVTVCLVGFEGALRVAEGPLRTAIAAAAVAGGAVLHVVLSRRSEQRFGQGAATGYFSTLATFLAAEGVRVLLPAPIYPVLWALAAAGVAVLALPRSRPLFQAHAALLGGAAALASGLVLASVAALAYGARATWPGLAPASWAVLALVVATSALVQVGAPGTGPDRLAAAARVTSLVIALVSAGGVVARFAAQLVAQAPGAAGDPGRLAVVRTGVLVVAALALAARRATGGRRELGSLAAAVLVVAGAKLVGEDLRVGSAGSLVFSLVIFGTALVVTPTLTRRAASRAAAAKPG